MHNINVYFKELDTNQSSFDIFKYFFNQKYSFFLDSCEGKFKSERYSFIGFDPVQILEAKHNKVSIHNEKKEYFIDKSPFLAMKEFISKYKVINNTKFPFVGGAVGFFSYDLCHYLEELPKTAVDDLCLPDMIFGFYDTLIIIDHHDNKKYVLSLGYPDFTKEAAENKISKIKNKIEVSNTLDLSHLDRDYVNNEVELLSNFEYEQYIKSVEKILEYIRNGDIYQANMTQRFTTLIKRHPLNIYEKLRTINPAPFSSYFNFGDFQILSSSPERFLELRGDIVETKPIKGTMPRGSDTIKDNKNKTILINSLKDRAENTMIVDLMRNDIGRVCEFGTVNVPKLCEVEEFATVFHLVSTVTGQLKMGYHAVDLITACFPGGSITGAPKIRSMEIIDELEPTRRHIYTGSIGYIGFDGDMDINIVIRSILVKGNRAYYQVGGGIVWDSIPQNEYQETLDKGAALRKALLL